mgnify:FL=1
MFFVQRLQTIYGLKPLAHTAFVNQVPIAVVRCISDLADGDAHEDYAEFEKKASDIAAEIVMNALKKAADESIM